MNTRLTAISRLIANTRADATYEENLEAIYDNWYRCVTKAPVKMFFLGTMNTFKNYITIAEIKQVVKDAYEIGGD